MMEEIGIVSSDIIPLIVYAWNRSFARVKTNKKAILERGWFPYNRVLLIDPEIRDSMTREEERQEMREGLYPYHREALKEKELKKDWPSLDDNLLTQSNSFSSIPSPNMQSGTAQIVLCRIARRNDLNAARKAAKDNKVKGTTLKTRLEQSKKISSTVITSNGTHRLGKTVREVVFENRLKHQKILAQIKQNHINTYLQWVKDAEIMMNATKDKIDKKGKKGYTVKEMTVLLKPKKRKEDGRMPTKCDDLLAVFDLWMGRPNLEYEAIEKDTEANSESALLQTDVLPEEGGIEDKGCIDNNQSEALLI
jgi:hypothetical protein